MGREGGGREVERGGEEEGRQNLPQYQITFGPSLNTNTDVTHSLSLANSLYDDHSLNSTIRGTNTCLYSAPNKAFFVSEPKKEVTKVFKDAKVEVNE